MMLPIIRKLIVGLAIVIAVAALLPSQNGRRSSTRTSIILQMNGLSRRAASALLTFGVLSSQYFPTDSASAAPDQQIERVKVGGKTSVDGEAAKSFRQGIQCESDGELADAQNYYEQVISVEPDFIYAWANLGNVLTSRGNLEQALLCYKKALSLYPPKETIGVVILNKAAVELSLGRNEEAIKDLDIAERVGGPTQQILTTKAVAYTYDGKWQEAGEIFEQVISSADRNALPWWLRYSMALLETSRGTASVRSGATRSALSTYVPVMSFSYS